MKFTPVALGVLALSLTTNIAQAQLLDLGYQRITSNNVENIADQLSTSVYDKTQALMDFSSTSSSNYSQINNMTSNDVLFTFTNNVGVASTPSEIYFADTFDQLIGTNKTLSSQINILNSLSGFTKYTNGGKNGVNPSNLPGGNNISFVATSDFGADTQGKADNGFNNSEDILGIIIQLQSGVTFSGLQDSLADGTLRLGLHVRSIGSAGGSDSFINNPLILSGASAVPLPAAAWFFGPALLAVAGNIRRKKAI